ncbi:hypothetical protein H4R20_000622 [Coemansia guatemalensis]|uniref:RING-type E3 ubiquitin transferase n=1 Tax=Coemansia guatemalensis TaxID=2761395 RepID=A0A9W8LVN8_9FUNG|nr:hypothetical protein H4R20_000622 [Coemansia guatemalensis]
MPESIPTTMILRQMAGNVATAVVDTLRSAVVAVMWLFVLPYLVYWLTRFYFWSGQSVVFSPSHYNHTASPTSALGSYSSAGADAAISSTSAASRFVGFSSWSEWYASARTNATITPISSYTGALDGATNSVLVMYSLVRILVRASAEVLRMTLGIRISNKDFNDTADGLAEFLAKSAEGSVVTLSSILLFMAMFMLRDWIVTNAPINDEVVDDVDMEMEEEQPNEEAADNQRQEDAPVAEPHQLHVEGRPIVAENPQHRPIFEHPPHELPALNDLPPYERLVRPQLPRQQRIEAEDGLDDGAHPGHPDAWVAADAEGEPAPSRGSLVFRGTGVEEADARELNRLMDALPDTLRPATEDASHASTPSEVRTAWAYADEAFEEEDIMESDNSGSSAGSSSLGFDVSNGGAGVGIEVARHESHSISSNSEDAWSFVNRGESSRSASDPDPASSARNAHFGLHGERSGVALPPTFTGEGSRAIYAHARHRWTSDSDNSSNNASDDDDSTNDSGLDGTTTAAERERDEQAAVAALRQLRDEGIRELQRQQRDQEPVVDPGRGAEHVHEQQENPQQQQPDPQQQQQQAEQAEQAQDGAVGDAGVDFDDNFGDFEGAEGLLEAMGFRGPLVNSAQYYVLVLVVVGMVLAFFAWLPYICGRAFVALNPIRAIFYCAHLLLTSIDAASEFMLDLLPLLLWQHARPVVAALTNILGPVLVYALAPFAPGIKDALSTTEGSLWSKLHSPPVQTLLVGMLRKSWFIRVLFPWAWAEPTKTMDVDGSAPMGAAGSASKRGLMQLAPVARVLGWMPDGVREAFGFLAFAGETRELSGSLALMGWGRELWQRLVRWGVPIDKIVLRFEEASEGPTLDDRILMITIGHLLGILSAWAIVTYTPRELRRSALYSSARMFLRMAKIVFFIFIELMLFPVLCGYCLDVSLMPLLSSASLWSRYVALVEQRWVSLFTHWLLGMLFMVHFARLVLHCRQVMRPGLLWFIRDPNDPEFNPMREILEDHMLPQQYNIARSALMYCGIILSCVGLSMQVAVKAAPTVFPIKWMPSARFSDYPTSILFMVFLLPVAMMWGRPNEVLHFLFSHWWRVAARTTRLSEFILGERSILDEGEWMYRESPRLPVLLPRLTMPTHVVQEVFDVFNATTFDQARTGPIAGALPTSEYVAKLQEAIDRALDESHPRVRFVLGGHNFRVPAVDTLPVVQGRVMLVRVDDRGYPADDRFDYETADDPELRNLEENQGRDLPPPAPESGYRDRRFRSEHYGVIYVPPMLRVRVCAVLAFGWLAIAAISSTTLVLSLIIGRSMYMYMGALPMHDMYALSIGLLVLLIVAVLIYRVAMYLEDVFSQGNDNGAAWRIIRHKLRQVWTSIWKIAVTGVVFFGVIPALLGLVVEVYFVVLLRHSIDMREVGEALSRNPMQAIAQNWMFGVLHVWIGLTVVRFFPGLPWNQQFVRLYTGAPHTWHVWQGIAVFAMPIIGMALASVAIPFAMAVAVKWAMGTLSAATMTRVLLLQDLRLLAYCVEVVLCSAICSALSWQAVTLYRQWSRSARDRVYLVGQRLHNLGDPADAPPNSAGPATGAT